MTDPSKKACGCKSCPSGSCTCAGRLPPKAGECCCGPTCTCGPACACPPSCNCPATRTA
ncbi:MAG: hypothetical protein KF850_16605 [Labilithrix sp.]|nr:hypothetical protein [Labilithrix sp.]MBX3213661.1 hypothetical protein [Labilithrix sp.]